MNTLTENQFATPPATRKKYGMLPVLVVLFLISYGLMSMLVIEQGNTIQHQRYLIGDLLKDSGELSAMKMKIIRDKAMAAEKNRSHLPPPVAGNPAQAPAGKSSGSQNSATPQVRTRHGNDKVPPRTAADMLDARRVLRTI